MVVKVKDAETKRNKASVAHTGWNKRTKTSTTTPKKVERASFTPLVFSATGGMAPRAKVFYKKLSDLLAVQRKDNYSHTIALVRAMLNFSLLRDAIASLRGARSAKGRFDRFVTSVDVAVVESRVEV